MLMKSPLGWSQHLQSWVLNWITMSDFSPTTFPRGLSPAAGCSCSRMQAEWTLEAALHFLISMIAEIMGDFYAGWFHGVPAGLARHWWTGWLQFRWHIWACWSPRWLWTSFPRPLAAASPLPCITSSSYISRNARGTFKNGTNENDRLLGWSNQPTNASRQ